MSTLLALSLSSLVVSASPAHWFERPSCQKAMELVMSSEFTQADKKIRALEASRDVEDKACAVWSRVSMATAQISVGGRMPALLKNRDRMLLRMFKFGRARANYSPYIADLAIEARMRRSRILAERGERSKALKEAKRLKEMLAKRKTKITTPTSHYVRGSVNMAASQAPWALRVLLTISGHSGDAEVGRKHLRALIDGTTVYRYEALYVLHHFAQSNPSPENGRAVEYSKRLVERFPSNPQWIYDFAKDLQGERRCIESLEVVAPANQRLEKNPNLWSNQVRAKLFWVTGRCAKDLGDLRTARKYASLAAQQRFDGLSEVIQTLQEELAL